MVVVTVVPRNAVRLSVCLEMYLKKKTLSTVSNTMFIFFLMEKSAIDTKSSGKKRQVIEFVD